MPSWTPADSLRGDRPAAVAVDGERERLGVPIVLIAPVDELLVGVQIAILVAAVVVGPRRFQPVNTRAAA